MSENSSGHPSESQVIKWNWQVFSSIAGALEEKSPKFILFNRLKLYLYIPSFISYLPTLFFVPSDRRVSNIVWTLPPAPVFKMLNTFPSLICISNQEVKAFVPCWMPGWLKIPSKALMISSGAEWWSLWQQVLTLKCENPAKMNKASNLWILVLIQLKPVSLICDSCHQWINSKFLNTNWHLSNHYVKDVFCLLINLFL